MQFSMKPQPIIWFAWRPQWWAGLPVLISLLGAGVAYGASRVALVFGPNIVLWVLLTLLALVTCYVVILTRRQGLEALGVTERNWPQAIGVGAVLGVMLGALFGFRALAAGDVLVTPPLDMRLLALALSLALMVACEEVFFRGWLQSSVEQWLGVVPAVILSSAAYTGFFLAFIAGAEALRAVIRTPAGHLLTLPQDAIVLLLVALFFGLVFRVTGNLLASGAASFLSRFALTFVFGTAELASASPALMLAVLLALGAVLTLYVWRWLNLARPAPARSARKPRW
jgi:membrane protease YdiL (CAAX protease family)